MMIEFLPDPDALLHDLDLGDLGDHVPDDQLGDTATSPALGGPDIAAHAGDLSLAPDLLVDHSQDVVSESSTWAAAAQIALPDPFSVAMTVGTGVIGAASRRRARRAAERQARRGGNKT